MYLIIPFAILIFYLIFNSQNDAVKKYFLLAIIIILPLTNNFFPPTKVLSITMTTQRILTIPLLLIFPFMLASKARKIFNNKFIFSIILYILYYFIRGAIYGEIPPTMIIESVLYIISFFLVEILVYKEKDRIKLTYYISFLAIFAAFVSYMQIAGNGQFYRGLSLELEKDRLITAFESTTRNPSVFGLFPDVTLIIGFLSIYFIFQFYKTKNRIFLILYAIAFVTAFVTFDRSALIAPIIGLMAFVYLKNSNKRNALFAMIAATGTIFILGYIFIILFENTAMYQDRILSKSYTARTETLNIFFNHLIDKNVAFGFGSEQHPESFRKYGRGGGSLNGFISIYVYGGLLGLLLFLNILRVLYKRIKLYANRTNDYEFYVFPISFILYNFTVSTPYFFYWPSFLIFWIYFRMNEQLSYMETTSLSIIENKKEI